VNSLFTRPTFQFVSHKQNFKILPLTIAHVAYILDTGEHSFNIQRALLLCAANQRGRHCSKSGMCIPELGGRLLTIQCGTLNCTLCMCVCVYVMQKTQKQCWVCSDFIRRFQSCRREQCSGECTLATSAHRVEFFVHHVQLNNERCM
jgi:hypothetical protein